MLRFTKFSSIVVLAAFVFIITQITGCGEDEVIDDAELYALDGMDALEDTLEKTKKYSPCFPLSRVGW